MNAQVMIKELVKDMKEMPQKDIKTIQEFVEYLRDRELEEDILTSRKLLNAVKKSQKTWKEKGASGFLDWEDVKKKNKL